MEAHLRVGITPGEGGDKAYDLILSIVGLEGVAELFTPVILGSLDKIEEAKKRSETPNLKINIAENPKDIKGARVNYTATHDALKKGFLDVLVSVPLKESDFGTAGTGFLPAFVSPLVRNGNNGSLIFCHEDFRVSLLDVDPEDSHKTSGTLAKSREEQAENGSKTGDINSEKENDSKAAAQDHAKESEDHTLEADDTTVTEDAVSETERRLGEKVESFMKSLKHDFGVVRPSVAILKSTDEEVNKIYEKVSEYLIQKGMLAFGPFDPEEIYSDNKYKKFDGVMAPDLAKALKPFRERFAGSCIAYIAGLPYVITFGVKEKGNSDISTAEGVNISEKETASLKDSIYLAIDIFRRRNIFKESASNPLKKYVHERPEKGDKHDHGEIPHHSLHKEKNKENHD